MKTILHILFALVIFLSPHISEAATALTGTSSYSGTNGVALSITDLQITGAATSTVPVKLFVTSGSLQMTTTTGITFDGSSTGSTIYFSGTMANVNAALATLKYTRIGTGSDTLEVSLVNKGEVFFTGTNHLYQYVPYSSTWSQAYTDSLAKSMYGANGYLVTITSQAENNFVAARVTDAGWMGASDSSAEGTWKWLIGPENGTTFWSGAANGNVVGGNYANWGGTEPNDSVGNEDCAQYLAGGTGEWNDLNCSTALPGYVVEYGAPGNMPVVTAKNITVTTTDSPIISTVTPSDNATNVGTSTNLTVVFNQNVSTSTGNIIIRKVSDDTVFEIISIASSTITGTSATYVINPVQNFAESTGYYITIPSTAFTNTGNGFYGGTTASSTWNFTTGDFTAPIITQIVSTTTSTTASFTWTTNELASSRILFGTTRSFGTSTAVTDISPRVTSHTVNISALPACTTFYYAVVSSDASSNSTTSSDKEFTTTGCAGTTPPVSATSSSITSSTGGTQALTTPNATLTVTAPANFTSTSSTVVIQIQALEGTEVHAALGKPDPSLNKIGNIVFDIKAIINSTTVLDSFDSPVTITYTYTDEDITNIDESTLWLYHYHNNAWSRLDSCSVNETTNTITCTTQSFSIFSLFGQNKKVAATFTGPRYGGTVYGCKDTSALNYNKYSAHDQKLCTYATVVKTDVKTDIKNDVRLEANPMFTKNLYMGMINSEVKMLQKFLNEKGFTVSTTGAGAVGSETTKFGSATKAALIKYQKAMKITPAVGYFGPVTRASVK